MMILKRDSVNNKRLNDYFFSPECNGNPTLILAWIAVESGNMINKNSLTFRFNNYNFPSFISSTISGFNNVEISPKAVKSPSAIFRKIRRIIFPERVFGNPDTN